VTFNGENNRDIMNISAPRSKPSFSPEKKRQAYLSKLMKQAGKGRNGAEEFFNKT
jgi:hypothetical protein